MNSGTSLEFSVIDCQASLINIHLYIIEGEIKEFWSLGATLFVEIAIKGQVISEANYLDLNFSKKQTKNFCLVARAKNFTHCLRFLEELRTRKIASEIK